MAGLPIDHYDARIVSLQTAVVNHEVDISTLQDDVTSLKAALENIHGGLPMNQEDLMNQLLGTVSLAGSSPLGYDDIQSMKEMMEDATRGARTETGARSATPADPYGVASAPNWGGDASDSIVSAPVGVPGTAIGSAPITRGIDKSSIEHIIKIREKLDDFLDGSNVLVKIMNPQTIREMVREMRQEIRAIKKEESISELDIVNHLEEELADEENRRADARARIDKYDADNEVPF